MKKIQFILMLLAVTFTGATIASCQANPGQDAVNQLTVNEFTEKLKNNPNAVILDVRTPGEFAAGHIPNAVNIDYNSNEFDNKIQSLDPAKEYYVYCASGNRSGKASRIMAEKGFKQVNNLANGGYGDWLRMKR